MSEENQNNPYAPPQARVEDAGGTDATFKLNILSPAGRIGRIRFLGYSMGFSFLIMLVAGILSAVVGPWLLVAAYLPLFYVQAILTIKRSHDFNSSGWLALLALVPVVSLIFLFIPGTDGPNRFGNKTPPNGGAAAFAIVAVIGVAVIGILAAIAIPAYQQYSAKAQAAQVQVR